MRSLLLALGLAVLVTGALAQTGCAPTVAGARPSPFPGRTAPPTAAAVARRAAAEDVVRTALTLRGTSYRLGGDTPASGFDCSGLVHYVFAREAIDLPRTVAEQFAIGARVRTDRVEAGDLIFFATTASGPTHVGIAIDDEQFVHAPGSGGAVRVERLTTPYWNRRVVGVRRVAELN